MKIKKIVRGKVALSVDNGSSYKDHENRRIQKVEYTRETLPDLLVLLAEKLEEETKELKVEILKAVDSLRRNPASVQDVYNPALLDEFADVTTVVSTIASVLDFNTTLVDSLAQYKINAKGSFVEQTEVGRSFFYIYTADSHTYHEKFRILKIAKETT